MPKSRISAVCMGSESAKVSIWRLLFCYPAQLPGLQRFRKFHHHMSCLILQERYAVALLPAIASVLPIQRAVVPLGNSAHATNFEKTEEMS